MKPIVRALADAARQLDDSSDTARLDSELLMAEALHIDRDKLILSPPDRQVPDALLGRWSNGERPASRSPISRAPGLLEYRAPCRPRRSRAAAGFRGTDRLGHRAFRGQRRVRSGSSTSAPDPAPCYLRRSISGRKRPGLASTVSRHALSYAAANARRLGFEPRVKFKLGNWAKGFARPSISSCAIRPMLPKVPKLGPGVREYRAGRGAVRRRGRARRLSRSWRPNCPGC